MIIIGLDPGIARTGFGVIDTTSPQIFVRCGCITTLSTQPTPDRLRIIGDDIATLLTTYRPDWAVVETVLFGNNAKTAMLTAETRGVVNYVLRQKNVAVYNLTPLQIKSRLTGYGAADKHQIQQVVTKRLKLDHIPEPDDAADALAAAMCMAEELALSSELAPYSS